MLEEIFILLNNVVLVAIWLYRLTCNILAGRLSIGSKASKVSKSGTLVSQGSRRLSTAPKDKAADKVEQESEWLSLLSIY